MRAGLDDECQRSGRGVLLGTEQVVSRIEQAVQCSERRFRVEKRRVVRRQVPAGCAIINRRAISPAEGPEIVSNTIIDDYELLNCLATGNISQIWEVKQVSSSQTFAMKLLLPEALADADHKASLKHE